jgi:hypothetical protein
VIGDHEVESAGHALEVQLGYQQGPVADLSPGARAEEASQMRVRAAPALRRLILKSAEGLELAFGFEDALDSCRAQRPDQLVLEVGCADEKADRLRFLTRELAAKPDALQAALDVRLLGRVVETRQAKA